MSGVKGESIELTCCHLYKSQKQRDIIEDTNNLTRKLIQGIEYFNQSLTTFLAMHHFTG